MGNEKAALAWSGSTRKSEPILTAAVAQPALSVGAER